MTVTALVFQNRGALATSTLLRTVTELRRLEREIRMRDRLAAVGVWLQVSP